MFTDSGCSGCLVRHISCFDTLSKVELELLDKGKIITFYKKGQVVFHEGRVPTGLFCLKSGKVKISKIGCDGKGQIVRIVLSGGLLGIRSFLAGRYYMSTATTLEDSLVCFIDRPVFSNITTRNPLISHCIMTTLCNLLKEAEEKMTSLAQKQVRERLAETLLILDNIYKSQDNQIEDTGISLSREDLANIVGTATETVIRLLKEFKNENIIYTNGRKIHLKDVESLKKIARHF
nr:Crp/Fnr family transcriptional regulator [Bacteroidota bacterium]